MPLLPQAISAVVVTYNSARCVARCIASVRDVFPETEIVVVDNRSGDDTVAVLRDFSSHVQLIKNDENLGFGRACNIGAKAACGSHILFLNPDSVLSAVDHERLRQILPVRPFGIIAPSLEGEDDPRRRENSVVRDYLAHTLETIWPSKWRHQYTKYRGANVAWVSGGMLLVSREEFLAQGGFDSRFFLYYEDRDLSHRYRNANLPIRTTDLIRGHHVRGGSSASDGLRVDPMAWSLLGWVQYLFIYRGERTAKYAAHATLTTLCVLRFGMKALAIARWDRARRKATQLNHLLTRVAHYAQTDDRGFCPDALRVVRSLGL